MERMEIIPRIIESRVRQALERQKSVLLLGPRQTGKTTLVETLKPDLLLNFLRPEVRQRYERAPQLLGAEVEALAERTRGRRAAGRPRRSAARAGIGERGAGPG